MEKNNDIEWLVLKMEADLEREKIRLEKLQDQVDNFQSFLDNKVTQSRDFLKEMEEILQRFKTNI
jgi:hypothetical protein|tara:strand:+ start:166 stop:360 length:195 start_codon:yes stop_codon:yes gene_type:complete